MVSVHDVAAYILKRRGPVSAMKLQKLVYYCKAWSLVWDDDPLFNEPVEAWANGPVVPALYAAHKGMFLVEPGSVQGNPDALTATQRETVDRVLAFYGDKAPHWLSDLSHREDPWRLARSGLPDGARGNAVITRESMYAYYSSL